MKFKQWRGFICLVVFMCFEGGLEANFTLFWPTSNSAFTKDSKLDYLVQPTESGKLKSGLFGCVRNNGEKFHEGLDLAPIRRDQKGEPMDPIFVAMDGRVVYINRVEVSSNYGLYIVIEHSNIKSTLYTLYAHLRSINMSIEVGDKVNAGDKIGVMGMQFPPSAHTFILKLACDLVMHLIIGIRRNIQNLIFMVIIMA